MADYRYSFQDVKRVYQPQWMAPEGTVMQERKLSFHEGCFLVFFLPEAGVRTTKCSKIIKYIKYLLTQCDVCVGKYLPEVFVQTKRRSEVCAKKQKLNTFQSGQSKRGS